MRKKPEEWSPAGPPSEIHAVVGNLRGEGTDRYAVTYPRPDSCFSAGETITFTLSDWKGASEPRKGEVVRLRELRQFVKGWRALWAGPSVISSHKPQETR